MFIKFHDQNDSVLSINGYKHIELWKGHEDGEMVLYISTDLPEADYKFSYDNEANMLNDYNTVTKQIELEHNKLNKEE